MQGVGKWLGIDFQLNKYKHNNGQHRGQKFSFSTREIVQRRMYWQDVCTQPPWNEMTWKACEWKSPWYLTTDGQHVKDKKWQNVTPVLHGSFGFKTKGPFKVCLCEWVCLRLSLCPSVFSSNFCWHQINQIASYHYDNHVCHSKRSKRICLSDTK